MKKILIILSFVFAAIASMAQTKSDVRIGQPNAINHYTGAILADSVIGFPTSSGQPTINMLNYRTIKRFGALQFDTLNHVWWQYDPSSNTWDTLAGSGGGGSSSTLFPQFGSRAAMGNVTGDLSNFNLNISNADTLNFGANTYNFLSAPSTYSFGGYDILGVNQLTGNIQLVPGSSVTASNGLNISGIDVQLGGTLTKNTSIQTSTFGLTVQSNASAVPLQTSSQNNVAFSATTVSGQYAAGFAAIPNIDDTVYTIARLTNNGTGVGANGIGASLDFANATTTTTDLSNRLVSQWTDATNATKTSQFSITGFNSGTQSTLLTLSGSGATQLNKYGVGSFTTGTPAYQLAVTAAGNIIETSVASATVILDSVVLDFDGLHADTTFTLTRSGFKNLEIQAEETDAGGFIQKFNDTQGILEWQVAIRGSKKFYITYYY